MMLFKLSLKNIKKSIKDYAIYFFTLILGVAIFYCFNSIESQTVMMKVTSDTRDIIKLMTSILSGVSVFVSFILGFLIIYASRFLIKRRNKEFGIYLTLGMSKRKISTILFFETLLIGILSLVVGLIAGVVLSQFMSLIVANLFEADLTEFVFTFSGEALIKTLLYFGIMYFLVMIFNTVSVGRYKLIDLLNAGKKSEKIKIKNPVLCTIVFILSCLLLSYAYYLVTDGLSELGDVQAILKPIFMGCISTFFIFWSLSGLIIKIMSHMKKFYYKGLNSFIIRQFSSKINTAVMSISVISIMLFVTICVFSAALSIKNSMSNNLKTLVPMDVELYKKRDLTIRTAADNWRYNENMIDDAKISLRETLTNLDFDVDKYFKDIVEFNIYSSESVTIRTTLGDAFDDVFNQFRYMQFDSREQIMSISDYNKLAQVFNEKELTLNDDEYLVLADYKELIRVRNLGLESNTPLTIGDAKLYPKNKECVDGFIEMNANHANPGVFIVPDSVIDQLELDSNMMVANYNASTDDEKETIEKIVAEDLEHHDYAKFTSLSGSTKLSIYSASVGLGAMVTFIGLYLGIIFLLSCAAILALKELSESTDNRDRFRVLRRIGADEKLINRALFKQIAIFFLAPLILAIIHSVFGIKFSMFILSTFGTEKLLPSIIMTAVFLILIYGGYFLLTYHSSKNIIREKR